MAKKKVAGINKIESLSNAPNSFLKYHRLKVSNRYQDGSLSKPYTTEYFDRTGFDAIAMAVFHENEGTLFMGVIQGVRPAMILRSEKDLPVKESHTRLYMPEAVAGSIDPEDRGQAGLINRAILEIEEEAGFKVSSKDILSLGAGYFPSHGQCTEKIFLCAARVNPDQQQNALGDGSINEHDSLKIEFVPHLEIMKRCLGGEYEDPKLEILSNRLALLTAHFPWEQEPPHSSQTRQNECRNFQGIQQSNFLK